MSASEKQAEPLAPVVDSARPGVSEVVSPVPARKMKHVAKAGLKVLLRTVPSLLGSCLWGALKGFVLFGLGGLALAAAFVAVPRALDWPATPTWLEVLSLVLSPLALALAGAWVLVLHAVASRLAQEAQERRWMAHAYAVLKPAALQVAQRLRGSGKLEREELLLAVEESVAERLGDPSQARPPSSQLERFLMEQSRRVLGAIALRAVLTAPDVPTAVRELESLAVERLEMVLVERLEDLFFVQQVLVLGAGLLVAAIPAFILLFSR
ncbi:hypothetical protein NVS55_36690 [Myxococcus stipitatus]|uniref:hypothetical protein n=1 Tax=Myxococcus stipitatus TaxID=83455 RepID=UPI0031454F21